MLPTSIRQLQIDLLDEKNPCVAVNGIALHEDVDIPNQSKTSRESSVLRTNPYVPQHDPKHTPLATHHSIHIHHDDPISPTSSHEMVRQMSLHNDKLGALNSTIETQTSTTRYLQLFILMVVLVNAVVVLIVSFRGL